MKRSPITPSLYTADIEATTRFYTDVLGFTRTGAYQEPGEAVIWAEVARGEARIWFFTHSLPDYSGPAFNGLIYIFVEDVDDFAAALEGEVSFEWGPETQEYGLREVAIRDPNGYHLVFARDV